MAKYTEGFKRKAVALLTKLNKNGIVIVDGLQISNVRQLCFELNISTWSIYSWDKIYNPKDLDIDDSDDDLDIDEQILDGDEDWFGQEKKKSTGNQKEIFGIRYYAWFARNLGVKGYSSMVLAQLKLAIGNELIKQSGLVDMNKASKKLSQNGEGL